MEEKIRDFLTGMGYADIKNAPYTHTREELEMLFKKFLKIEKIEEEIKEFLTVMGYIRNAPYVFADDEEIKMFLLEFATDIGAVTEEGSP